MGQINKTVNALKCRLPKRINYQSLYAFAASEGWRVITFGDGGRGDLLIASCGLTDYASMVESFAFKDNKNATKFIAIRSEIGIDARKWLIAHELGHIMLGHMLGESSVDEENDANKFADKLLKRQTNGHKTKAIAIVTACVLAAGAIFGATYLLGQSNTVINDDPPIINHAYVYITSDGDCYHNEDCVYVTGSTKTLRISMVDALNFGKRPCSVCR